MTKSALLVVDMQEDFCPPTGALAVHGGREIASCINRLLSMPFTLKIASRDFHPADHVSFDTSHPAPNNKAFECSTTIANPQNPSETTTIPIWPAHCVQGTPGAEIIPEIDIAKIDRIIDKGRDRSVEMFSAFSDAFGNQSDAASFDLGAYLKKNGIKHVFVVGIAGEYCVRCTALDARKQGFDVCVVEDAVKSIDSGEKGWEAAQMEFGERRVRLVSSDGPEVQDVKLPSSS